MNKGIAARGCDKAEVVQVIRTSSLIGDGTEENPAREIVEFWSLSGERLACVDEWKQESR